LKNHNVITNNENQQSITVELLSMLKMIVKMQAQIY